MHDVIEIELAARTTAGGVFKAVRAGELDEQLKQSSKFGRPMPARKVA